MEERLSVSAGAHCSMKINESIVKRTGVESMHAVAKSDVSLDDKVLNTTPVNQKSIIEQSMVLGPDPKLITNQNSNQMSYTLSNKGGGPGSSTNLTSS